MRYRLVSANDKNVEVGDVLDGFGWVFWIVDRDGRRSIVTDDMNCLPNRQGEMATARATAEAFAFASAEARKRGVAA